MNQNFPIQFPTTHREAMFLQFAQNLIFSRDVNTSVSDLFEEYNNFITTPSMNPYNANVSQFNGEDMTYNRSNTFTETMNKYLSYITMDQNYNVIWKTDPSQLSIRDCLATRNGNSKKEDYGRKYQGVTTKNLLREEFSDSLDFLQKHLYNIYFPINESMAKSKLDKYKLTFNLPPFQYLVDKKIAPYEPCSIEIKKDISSRKSLYTKFQQRKKYEKNPNTIFKHAQIRESVKEEILKHIPEIDEYIFTDCFHVSPDANKSYNETCRRIVEKVTGMIQHAYESLLKNKENLICGIADSLQRKTSIFFDLVSDENTRDYNFTDIEKRYSNSIVLMGGASVENFKFMEIQAYLRMIDKETMHFFDNTKKYRNQIIDLKRKYGNAIDLSKWETRDCFPVKTKPSHFVVGSCSWCISNEEQIKLSEYLHESLKNIKLGGYQVLFDSPNDLVGFLMSPDIKDKLLTKNTYDEIEIRFKGQECSPVKDQYSHLELHSVGKLPSNMCVFNGVVYKQKSPKNNYKSKISRSGLFPTDEQLDDWVKRKVNCRS